MTEPLPTNPELKPDINLTTVTDPIARVEPTEAPDVSALTPAASLKPDWRYWLLLGLMAWVLLVAAQHIGMLNQGDYWRAIGKSLVYPEGFGSAFAAPQGVHWLFKDDLGKPMAGGGSSSLLFWLASLLQRPFTATFNLLLVGGAAQLFMLVIAERLAACIAVTAGWSNGARAILAFGFMFAFFAAHNIAFLNSFYMEFAFITGLPLLLLGLLGQQRGSRAALLVGALLCGAAKAQYFYLPTLLLAVLWFSAWRSGGRVARGAWVSLVLIQMVSLVPLLKSGYQQVNYHHSTRMGSYLVLEPDERAALGMTPELEACIGVDAWGHRLDSASGVHIVSSGHACGSGEALGLSDVLAPYLAYPQVLFRLWRDSAEVHFTVSYFHVDAKSLYRAPTGSDGYGWGWLLIRLSEWRDTVIGPSLALIILAGGFLLALWPRRSEVARLAPAVAFLSVFALSQLAVSLVGEGVRDLSRHWAGAQFSLDILLVLLVVHVVLLRQASRRAGTARR